MQAGRAGTALSLLSADLLRAARLSIRPYHGDRRQRTYPVDMDTVPPGDYATGLYQVSSAGIRDVASGPQEPRL
jgi:hypothetical protein